MDRPSERDLINPTRGDNVDKERYGVADYRTIKPWVFAARVLLRPKRRARMSIGTLHVKLVAARGLMARDSLLGRSDPYVKFDLSGRYLSTGQEWSETFRIKEQSQVVKYTLNPIWDEKFSLPVRRAGAFLRVELWDWNRGFADDPLGSFEVKIGEELLSGKAIDMWFVLDAPRDFEGPSSEVKAARETEQEQPSELEEEVNEETEAADMFAVGLTRAAPPTSWSSGLSRAPSHEVTATKSSSWSSGLGRRHKKRSKSKTRRRSMSSKLGGDSTSPPKHGGHSWGEKSETCGACIQRRRDQFGEVRLELRFEFNAFGEMCSHVWPEEPPKPVQTEFSPNRVYYNALLLQLLAWPYVSFLQQAIDVVYWVHPWNSLCWFIAVAVMLLRPCLLIIAINGSLGRGVVAAYLEFNFPLQEDDEQAKGAESSNNVGSSRRRLAKRRKRRSKKSFKVPKKSLLPPIDEQGDETLEEMYRAVRRTKKLPLVVEKIGRKLFAAEALQWQVETIGMVLMITRRLFRPVKTRSTVMTLVVLAGNAILQIWLYTTSRFHLYLLGCCCGVFAFNFYAWRGRAFIAGVKEAVRCRQLCLSLATTPTPFERGLRRQSSGEAVDHETALDGPVFAPPGATYA